jgi:hypothetical protein
MTSLSESRKRDFVSQFFLLLTNNSEELIAAGYDPAELAAKLQQELDVANAAETAQTNAEVAAQNATKAAQETLTQAYTSTSNAVELVAGLLGKNHNLVKEIRKLRK